MPKILKDWQTARIDLDKNEYGNVEFNELQDKLKLARQDVIDNPNDAEKLEYFNTLKNVSDKALRFRQDVIKRGAGSPQEVYSYRIPKNYPEEFEGWVKDDEGSSYPTQVSKGPYDTKFGDLKRAIRKAKYTFLGPPEPDTTRGTIQKHLLEEPEATNRQPSSTEKTYTFEQFQELPPGVQDELRKEYYYDKETKSYIPRK